MAVLTNKSIASTYTSLLSIGDTTTSSLSGSIQSLTDGTGQLSPLAMSTTQIQFNTSTNTFKFPADRGTINQILKLADANGTLSWADDNLSNTLNFSSGTGTGSVTLDTQTLAFTGTANEIVTSASSQAITLSFPTAGVVLPDGSEATTQASSDYSTKVATTAFVIDEIATSGISGSGADDQIAVFDGSNSVSSSSSFQYDGRILTLQDGVTGDKNIVIGNAGTFPTSNSSTGNVIIGNNAFNDVSQFHTGGENIIIGLNAGQDGTKLSSNILIGKNAGSSLGNVVASTQNSNVFIGQFAGAEITATEGNVILGGFDGDDGTINITTNNNNVVLSTGLGAVRAWFNSTGTLRLSAYNASNKTGTVTYLLGTDNSGNVLKTTAGTGTVAGTGTAGTITKWATGGADIEDSIITEAASAITVGGAATFSGDIIRKGNVGNISFEAGSVANINAQIQYDQINDTTGQLFFKTANSGTLATRLTISSEGNVIQSSGNLIIKNAVGDSNGLKLFQDVSDVSVIENHYSGSMKFNIAGSTKLTISSGGDVAIGAGSTLSKRLNVYDSSTSKTSQQVISDGGSTSKLYLGTFSNNAYLSQGGTYSSGWASDGTNAISQIIMSATDGNSQISFGTSTTNNVAPTDRLTISSEGNVGIGTTPSPQNLIVGSLDLNGGASVFGYDKRAYLASNVYYQGGWKVKEAGYGAFMLAGLTNGDFGFYTTTEGATDNATVTDIRSLHIASDGDLSTNNGTFTMHDVGGTPLAFKGKSSNGGSNISWYANNGTTRIGYLDIAQTAESKLNIETANNFEIYTDSTKRLTISSGGTVQVYGTASTNALSIDHSSSNDVLISIPFQSVNQDFVIRNSSAGVNLDYAATSWVSASDENIKENITSLDNVLDKIKNIRCVNYNLKDEEIYKKRLGFIAQDFQNDFEEVTSRDNDDVLGLRYTETIPILMKAIQEQQTIIEDLKARIETLEG